MKFLYLVMQPLVQRDYERFGIEFFLDKGHDVTVLDFSDAIHPKALNDRSKVVENSRLTIRELKSQKDLKSETDTFAASDLVFFFIYSLELSASTYPALKIIAETGTPYLLRAPAYYPGATYRKTKMSLGAAIKDTFTRLKKMNLLNSILGRLPRQWLGIPEATYVVYNGASSLRKMSLVGPTTIPIHAHAADFDLYLQYDKAKAEPESQAVFLDQFAPYHPGLIDSKSGGKIDPDVYYKRLRNLFDRIEAELGLRVVICCHPRADYSSFNDVFGDRDILYGETIQQIAKSKLVLAHLSTAINFAVLFRKPIMLLTTKEQYEQNPLQKHAYEGFSDELGVPLSYFEDPDKVDLSDVLSVNDEFFDRYTQKYIKTPNSPSKPLWDIVHDVIAAERPGPTH
jgi:hypothetical protein